MAITDKQSGTPVHEVSDRRFRGTRIRTTMLQRCSFGTMIWAAALCTALARRASRQAPGIAARLTPQPQRITSGEGHFALRDGLQVVGLPVGPEHEACRGVVTQALEQGGAVIRGEDAEGNSFVVGQRPRCRNLPEQGHARGGLRALRVARRRDGSRGVARRPAVRRADAAAVAADLVRGRAVCPA